MKFARARYLSIYLSAIVLMAGTMVREDVLFAQAVPSILWQSGGEKGADEIAMSDDANVLLLSRRDTSSGLSYVQAYSVIPSALKQFIHAWSATDRKASDSLPRLTTIAMSHDGKTAFWVTSDLQVEHAVLSTGERVAVPNAQLMAEAISKNPILGVTYDDSLAFVSNDTVIIFSPLTGTVGSGYPMHLDLSHSETVSALAFSPDGNYLAAGSSNGKLVVVNRQSHVVALVDSLQARLTSIVFHPKKTRIAYVSQSGSLTQHAFAGDTAKIFHAVAKGDMFRLCYVDAAYLECASRDGRWLHEAEYVLPVRNDSVQITFNSFPRVMPYSDNICVIDSGGDPQLLSLGSFTTTPIGDFHSSSNRLAFSVGNGHLASASTIPRGSQSAYPLYDISAWVGLWGSAYPFAVTGGNVFCVQYDQTGDLGWVSDSLVKIYGYNEYSHPLSFAPAFGADMAFIGMTPDAIVIVDSTLWRFTRDTLMRLPIPDTTLTGRAPVAVSYDAKRALLETSSGPKIFNVDDRAHPISIPPSSFGPPCEAKFSPDGMTIYISYGSYDAVKDSSFGETVAFDIRRERIVARTGFARMLAAGPLGLLAVTSTATHASFHLLGLDSLELLTSGWSDIPISSIAVANDSNIFVTATVDGSITLWQFEQAGHSIVAVRKPMKQRKVVRVTQGIDGTTTFHFTGNISGPVSLQVYDLLGHLLADVRGGTVTNDTYIPSWIAPSTGVYSYEITALGVRFSGVFSAVRN